MDLAGNLDAMRSYFETGITKDYHFRKAQLQLLKKAVLQHETEIFEALHQDLHKSAEESRITETGFFLSELKFALKRLKSWMEPVSAGTNLINFPSRSYLQAEPLGVTLIIGPWNYPFQLLCVPLIGAIAAGNCVVLKPSEEAPATSAVMKKIIQQNFGEQYIMYCEGPGETVVPDLMNNFIFDHVFYTGSTATGKVIYKLAAENLVPVTLEMGGKSPCIVENDANIKIAAKRIALPKFSNTGQMCVAPDYLLVHASVKEKLIAELKKCIHQFFGDDAQQSYDYGRIVNEKQFNRIEKYISNGRVLYGGKTDRKDLYIEPTLIEINNTNDPVMREEIFGPVLPVISFTEMSDALAIIKKNKNPLAMYIFTSSAKKETLWLDAVSFGGGCVNNASLHLTNPALPFGGRGASGMGMYHGKFSFDTFSHSKAIMKTPVWIDPSVKYPPYAGKLNLFKKITG